MTFWLGILLGAYVLLMVGLGLYAGSRVKDEEDYLVAGRRLPLWLAWGTLLATWFGAATVLGSSEAARSEGVRGTILDPFASGLALIVAGLFFARRVWEMKLLTVGDLFAQK
ncbi:MAG: sodium:solute symporter, partial [Planctomycetaceae bacterium]|nr:sodium:solute symporter [Planctomycetaceae bacterium]